MPAQIVEGALDLGREVGRREAGREGVVLVDLVEVRLDHRAFRRTVALQVHLEAEADVGCRTVERLPEDLRPELGQLQRDRRLLTVQQRRVPQADHLGREVPLRISEGRD